jgi:hypothetical protein
VILTTATLVIPNWAEGPVRACPELAEGNLLYLRCTSSNDAAAELHYRNSSIAASSASLPGRVTDSGSVAKGSSTMFSMSRKLGALVFT